MGKKKQLGKGINALLSNIENSSSKKKKREVVNELASTVADIPTISVELNPFQPRSAFDEQALEELATSITTYGLIQPITVRSLGDGKYQLISGERRLRASKLAKLEFIPAYVRIADDQEMLEMALVENIQREDLNAIEIAISYKRLLEECDLTHQLLSERIGKNRSTVTNYIRLLKLPSQIQQAIKENMMSMGHARALAGVDDLAIQLDVFRRQQTENLSVRQVEKLIQIYQGKSTVAKPKKQTTSLSPELLKIKDRLSHKFGTIVEIQRNDEGMGKILIKFGSDDELNDILDRVE